MLEQEAIQKARSYFLREDHLYDCAETTFMVLKEAFGLPDPTGSSEAMSFNGGVARSGSFCGAISGAAMAVGLLLELHAADHIKAKHLARLIVAQLMDDFMGDYQSVNCRDLIGLDIAEESQHRQFLESGIWRERCMRQIESVVRELFPLRDLENSALSEGASEETAGRA